MANLPFVVQPRLAPIIERIGSDEAGYIEIERRGYLTAGEKAFVQQIQQQDNGTIQLINLSRRIAAERKLELDKAYQLLIDVISGRGTTKAHEAISVEYAAELQQVLTELANARARETLVHASCLILNRIDANIGFEVIRELHPDIINGLDVLYTEEDNKSVERLIEEGAKGATGQESNESGTSDGNTGALDLDELEKKPEQDQQ